MYTFGCKTGNDKYWKTCHDNNLYIDGTNCSTYQDITGYVEYSATHVESGRPRLTTRPEDRILQRLVRSNRCLSAAQLHDQLVRHLHGALTKANVSNTTIVPSDQASYMQT